MSPASKSKSKSKDRPSAKAAKEQQKSSIKPSGSNNSGNGSPASAYNPISGTFHTLDTSTIASSPPFHDNGRFRNIDDTEEHSNGPHGTIFEYDSVSNNGSCSGESEDPKEKTANSTPRQEPTPGFDNDKRERIRLKNEKKHQRQRERRAQELHERCCGYLMSRKLEALSQQLVAMGFSSEQATLALMLNEGRVEESVSWLFEESGEDAQNDPKLGLGGNLKIDISEELSQISAMESSYKCSKQEIERAVVACEGDLKKAEETLKVQKQEPPATQSKPEETVDTKNQIRPQDKLTASVTIQQRRSERDFNNSKSASAVPVMVPTSSDPGNRNPQSSMTSLPKSLAEKRWAATGSIPSASLTMPPTMQLTSPAKVEARLGCIGNEGKNIQQGAMREPVIMMQRPQSINARQIPASSIIASPSVTAGGWYANNVSAVENIRPTGKLLFNQSAGSFGPEYKSSEQFYLQTPLQTPYKEIPHMYLPGDSTSAGLGGSWSIMGESPLRMVPTDPRGSWSIMGASSHSQTVPSSLGSYGSSSNGDWNSSGLKPEFDYTNIDWTLNSDVPTSKSSSCSLGLPLSRNGSGMRMGSTNGACISGLQDSGVATETSSSSAGLREWTSPFTGKDIFSLPRQFVTSPSP